MNFATSQLNSTLDLMWHLKWRLVQTWTTNTTEKFPPFDEILLSLMKYVPLMDPVLLLMKIHSYCPHFSDWPCLDFLLIYVWGCIFIPKVGKFIKGKRRIKYCSKTLLLFIFQERIHFIKCIVWLIMYMIEASKKSRMWQIIKIRIMKVPS